MIRILTLCAATLLAGTAHGNGATASFAAGGLEFRDSTDISIASEDLYLSPYEIRVDYVFHSSAGEPLIETLAFPMPRSITNPCSTSAASVSGSSCPASSCHSS